MGCRQNNRDFEDVSNDNETPELVPDLSDQFNQQAAEIQLDSKPVEASSEPETAYTDPFIERHRQGWKQRGKERAVRDRGRERGGREPE